MPSQHKIVQRRMSSTHLFFICLVLIGLEESIEGKSLDGSLVTRSVKKRVGDRFKDWKDEDEYVDHDYYKRKRFAVISIL